VNNGSSRITRLVEISSVVCLGAALALIQILIGGMRLLFSLPAYALLAVAAFLSIMLFRRARLPPDRLCLWSTAIFFSYILIRALLSPVAYLARPDIYSVLGGLIVYFLVVWVVIETRLRMLALAFLLVVAVVHVAIGAVQFRNGDNFMLIPFLQRFDYEWRASGFYICPNHLAGMLEVVGAFGLAIATWSRWPIWGRLLIGYLTAVCYGGLILTGSRGGYLSASASVLVFILLSVLILRRADRAFSVKVALAGIFVAAGIAGSCFLLLQKSDYLSGRAANIFETRNMRLDFWSAALQQWRLQPVSGTGAGTYLFFGRQFRTDRVQVDPIEVHNDYLHLLAEYGILGVLCFALFLVAHIRRAWRTFQWLGPKRVSTSGQLPSNALSLNIGCICSVSAYLVHSAFDFNLHVPANVLLLAFVFGLLANPGIERKSSSTASLPPAVLWRFALPVLGLIVIVQSVRLLPGEYFSERARAALRDFHPAEATLFALRGLSHEQRNPDLYNYLGRARLAQGYRIKDRRAEQSFYQSALDAFWQGRALVPRDENFPLELGYTYDALDRYPEAEWMFAEARALDPKSTMIRESYKAHLERWKTSGGRGL